MAGEYVDTVMIRSLDEQLQLYPEFTIRPGSRYVLLYHIPSDADESFRGNTVFFEEFIEKHEELRIQSFYPVVD
jgi:hypothetical protein